MSSWLRWGRSVAAVVVGYVLMGALITLVQETWFGGVSYTKSSTGVLVTAGFFTFLAAVVGGYAAGWIAGRRPMLHGLAMSCLVVLETTWLIRSGKTWDPVWFDVTAAGSLVAGILIGAWLHVCCARPMRLTSQV